MKDCPLGFSLIYVGGWGGDRWALVDSDLYPILVKRKWYVHRARKCDYVRSWDAGHKRVYLHHEVQRLRRRRKPSNEHVVMHRSGDTFDNTAANLRWGTRAKNLKDRPYRVRKGVA